jgi:hypothetical protein
VAEGECCCPAATERTEPLPGVGAGINAIFGEPGAFESPAAFDDAEDGGGSWVVASPGGFTVSGFDVVGTGMTVIFGPTDGAGGGAGGAAAATTGFGGAGGIAGAAAATGAGT